MNHEPIGPFFDPGGALAASDFQAGKLGAAQGGSEAHEDQSPIPQPGEAIWQDRHRPAKVHRHQWALLVGRLAVGALDPAPCVPECGGRGVERDARSGVLFTDRRETTL